MTPAERALLLAVAENFNPRRGANPFRHLISAVEAEAAPEEPSKSCETCGYAAPIQVGSPCVKCNDVDHWQPKPSVCPRCNDLGELQMPHGHGWYPCDYPGCPGKNENKNV